MTRHKKTFPFFLWHRRFGLAALLLIVILSITGILLNHTEQLKLDEVSIESDALLDWYNINPQGLPINFSSINTWISQWNQQLFLNGRSFYTHNENLRGFVQLNNTLVIAMENTIILADSEGEIIELMAVNTLGGIKSIGLLNNKIALLDSSSHFYLSDKDITEWHEQPAQALNWSLASAINEGQIKQLKQAYRGPGLSLERVILDLHSGRIFNASWGIYIMDASAVIMLLLSFSGVWIWWSRRLKIKSKRRHRKLY